MACNKTQYETPELAWGTVCHLIKQQKASKGDLEIYKCKKCSTRNHKVFHIGHRRYRERIKPATWENIKNSY